VSNSPSPALPLPIDSLPRPTEVAAVPPPTTPVEPAHEPIASRSVALRIIAILAVIGALWLAQPFLVPLLIGILLAYALTPLVTLLDRSHIPRALGALVVMGGVFGSVGGAVYAAGDQIQKIVEQLPEAARNLSTALARLNTDPSGSLQKMQKAATAVEKAASIPPAGAVAPAATRSSPLHVIVDQPGFGVGNFLLLSSIGLLGFAGQAAMVFFLTYFLLLGGDTFKRKLVRLTGPTLTHKKITVQILDDINVSIQKYLFMLLVTNLLVALLTWAALSGLGIENAGAWAVGAGLLHIVPYLGPGVTAVAIAMAAFMQFNSFPLAMLAGGASLTIATIVGTFVTTWMTGRIASMNSAAVFISLLFWSWLWGISGMLLSIPLIVILKVVSEHVQSLHPVAEMLGV
jgi:predicted PurR-regulated permease PerM